MMKQVFLLISWFLFTSIQADGLRQQGRKIKCSICGEDEERVVGAPDQMIFDAFQNRTISCGLLQLEGQLGVIPLEICAANYFGAFAKQCHCISSSLLSIDEQAPTRTASSAPIPSSFRTSMRDFLHPLRHMFGYDKSMTKTDEDIMNVPLGSIIKGSIPAVSGWHQHDQAQRRTQSLLSIWPIIILLVIAIVGILGVTCFCIMVKNGGTISMEPSAARRRQGEFEFSRREGGVRVSDPTTNHETRNSEVPATATSDPIVRQKVLDVLFPNQKKANSGHGLQYDPLTKSYRFSDDRKRKKVSSCSICLERVADNDQIISGPCAHTYHRGCIMDWLLRNNNYCPLCRQLMWEPATFTMIAESVLTIPDIEDLA